MNFITSIKKVILISLIALLFTSCPDTLFKPINQSAELSNRATESIPTIKRLTGVNWFGFETANYVPHGLWIRDYKSMLQQMRDLGFNCIRLPYSNEMLNKTPTSGIQINAYGLDPYTRKIGLNTDLAGLSSLQILDKIIDEAGKMGLRIILDNHSRKADAYMEETLWYRVDFTEAQWIADWQMIALRYKNKPAVVAYDLNNEPHGGLYGMGMKPPASWGYDVPGYGITDWKKAAEKCALAVQAIDPEKVIIIQGVQEVGTSNYWWGSNHKGLVAYPFTSAVPKNRLMYSVHEYGPEVAAQDWFTDPTFPNNLESVWKDRFWFIYEQGLGGVYIGEMGLKEESANNPDSIPYKWFTKFMEFAGKKVHWTYWCWNPNSGDTGGILKDDWVTVNPVKYAMIKPYLEPFTDPTPTPTPTATSTPTATPTPIATPTPSASPTPTPTATPTPTPSTTPTNFLGKIEFYNSSLTDNTNTISVRIKLTITGGTLDLSKTELRYFLTKDGLSGVNFTCDHSGGTLSGSYTNFTPKITSSFNALSPIVTSADSFVSIKFVTATGILVKNDFIEIQGRITNSAWQNFTQSNDYSFLPGVSSYAPYTRLPLYISGTLTVGAAP